MNRYQMLKEMRSVKPVPPTFWDTVHPAFVAVIEDATGGIAQHTAGGSTWFLPGFKEGLQAAPLQYKYELFTRNRDVISRVEGTASASKEDLVRIAIAAAGFVRGYATPEGNEIRERAEATFAGPRETASDIGFALERATDIEQRMPKFSIDTSLNADMAAAMALACTGFGLLSPEDFTKNYPDYKVPQARVVADCARQTAFWASQTLVWVNLHKEGAITPVDAYAASLACFSLLNAMLRVVAR